MKVKKAKEKIWKLCIYLSAHGEQELSYKIRKLLETNNIKLKAVTAIAPDTA